MSYYKKESTEITSPTSVADDSQILTPSTNYTWIVILLAILIIIIFWIYILFILETNPPVKTNLILQCSPGQCATSLITGNKTCPTTVDGVMSINPALQVCNSPYTCEDPSTPYALQKDGSTNSNGICPIDTDAGPCNCLTIPQCGYYVPTVFSSQNGNTNAPVQNQRIFFSQSTYTSTATNQFLNSPPLSVNGSSQFCSIPPYWANRTWPSILDDQNSLGSCVQGVAAFIPDDINNFNINRVNSTPLACVNGSVCPNNTVAVWDKKASQNQLVCRDVCGGRKLVWNESNNQFVCSPN